MKLEEEKTKIPEGTEDSILLEQIIVPEEFLDSHLNPEKTQQVINYVKRTGQLDEPIVINRETKSLSDDYRRISWPPKKIKWTLYLYHMKK